jgi:hypothetical protein
MHLQDPGFSLQYLCVHARSLASCEPHDAAEGCAEADLVAGQLSLEEFCAGQRLLFLEAALGADLEAFYWDCVARDRAEVVLDSS